MTEELELEDLNLHFSSIKTTTASYLNFFQLNQQKSEIVDQLTRNHIVSTSKFLPNSPAICLLQEPFYCKQGNFYGPDSTYAPAIFLKQPGIRARAAIWCPKIYNPRPVHQLTSRDSAAAAITVGNESFLIISLYNPPKSDPSGLLSTVEGNITSSHLSCTIIGGDLNCKSYLWGPGPKHSKFGEIFEGFALHNNLTCLNPPSHDPTFVGPQGTSHIDASFASTYLSDKICNWNLLPIDVFEGLDHRPITFSLQLQSTIAHSPPTYDFRKISKPQYRSLLGTHLPPLLSKWNNLELKSSEEIDKAIDDISLTGIVSNSQFSLSLPSI